MTIRTMPKGIAPITPRSFAWDAPSNLLDMWAAQSPSAAEADDPNTISIMDAIGSDMFGDGVSEKRIAAALRSIGNHDITVKINSPGGDMFAGLAIYNLLREHPKKVTVKVMGVAASAASLIAMAGDEIHMAEGSIMMIHNAWGDVIGNRHDFEEAGRIFSQFDNSMATIYAARTGISVEEITKLLDGEAKASDGTYMSAVESVEKGFADVALSSYNESRNEKGTSYASADDQRSSDARAKRRVEAALAAQGVTRKERAAIIRDIRGQRDAPPEGAERDASDLRASLAALLNTFKG